MDLDKLLYVSTYAGKILLENGAEIYRVEDTITRICYSYGVNTCDAFATPTGIMVSLYHNNNSASIVKRITKRTVNLDKVHNINALSRSIISDSISLDNFYSLLNDIDKEPKYNSKILYFFSAISAGSFSIIFGGGLFDFITSFIIGFVISLTSESFRKLSINDFFKNYICGGITAILALVAKQIGININFDSTIIGSIMLLVPGLAITNAVRDIIAGDLLAGVTKVCEAILVAIAIAVGIGSVLSFWISLLGGKI
ncbi:MAG: threonine/serine exporter family protein [Clostridiales bacterium]|nr:threonine/serine exporter family protein [Clostridiales bacterium]